MNGLRMPAASLALACAIAVLILGGCGGRLGRVAADGTLISPVDRAEIHSLIALYAHAFDGRNIDRWVDLFTEDGEIVTSSVGSPKGKAALRSWARARFESRSGYQIRHFSTNILVDPVSANHVRARSYVLVTQQKLAEQAQAEVLYTGVYQDEIRRTDRGWRFSRREAEVAIPLDAGFFCAADC